MARWLASLLLLLCLPLGAREPLRVGAGRQSLLGHLEAFLDPSRAIAFEAIPSEPFQALPGEAAFGHDPGVLWLRLRLDWAEVPTGERWLEMSSSLLDRVSLYRLGVDGRWNVQHSGRHIPFSQRTLGTRLPTFRLPATSTGNEILFLRIETQGSIVLTPTLWEPSLHAASHAREEWWVGLSAGLMLLLTATHLSLGITLKDRTNTIYACYTGTSLLASLSFSGLFAFLLTPELPRLDFWMLAWSLPILLGLTWPVFSSIIAFEERYPRLDRALTWGTLALALVLALGRFAGFNHTVGPIMTVGFLLLLPGVFVTACWQVLAGNRAARFYLLAFVPLLLILGAEMARNMGLVQFDIFTSEIGDIAGFGHLMALSIPVVLRLLRIKQERDASMARELETSQRNERELEAQVLERTRDLATAKAQAEGSLVSAEEVLEGQRRLIQTVSHEFRTPLAIIDGTAQLLELQSEPDPSGKPSPASTIRAKVRRLLDFLDGALRQNQLESGSWRMVREPIEPIALLQAVLTRVDPDPILHPLSLSLDHMPGQFEADPRMLSILLVNLIENAIRYSPEGGEIFIAAEGLPDGGLRIYVSDQGIGIAPQHLDRVFDRFYRSGELSGVDGSGLGLYLSREIAQMHGGQLTVESRPGKGSTFCLTLPAPAAV